MTRSVNATSLEPLLRGWRGASAVEQSGVEKPDDLREGPCVTVAGRKPVDAGVPGLHRSVSSPRFPQLWKSLWKNRIVTKEVHEWWSVFRPFHKAGHQLPGFSTIRLPPDFDAIP